MKDLEPTAAPPRYVLGIDLGTTNSALAFVDTDEKPWQVRTFPIPQLIAPSTVEARETLPSFAYAPPVGELGEGALRLPWSADGTSTAEPHTDPHTNPQWIVGIHAREQGAAVPGRLVASAKSWLSHAGVDRTAPCLPWQGRPEVPKLSPMEASARYLGHLRGAWNAAHPEHPLEAQDVVLTVPASFDEIARELTVEAARQAGIRRVTLIEEPQAAFYAWLDRHARDPESETPLSPGQTLLIADVGGGTTDLTLIEVKEDTVKEDTVKEDTRDGDGLRFHRVAVGEHLILGGDNLDLALAHHLEREQLDGRELDPRQWNLLVQRCRQAKEALLGEAPPESFPITLPGGGSSLVGGALRLEIDRETVHRLLVEGFLPRVDAAARPERPRSGFRQFGLPYAADSAITRYLAAFLADHPPPKRSGGTFSAAPSKRSGGTFSEPTAARPDVVLLNGGFFASPVLRERFLDVLASWLEQGGEPFTPRVLSCPRLDLAVAQGAAYYGMVRRGEGRRIQAGLAHAYYIGVDASDGAQDGDATPTAVCLVPAGMEEGEDVVLSERPFELLIRQPVELPIYASSKRTTDRPGELIAVDPTQLRALPPIRTVLRSGKKTAGAARVEVEIHARLTEIGTLEVWCREVRGERTWRLQFDVRAAVQSDAETHEGAGEAAGVIDESLVRAAAETVDAAYTREGSGTPERLVKDLEAAVDMERGEWPPSLLRAIWEALFDHERGRKLSIAHEIRWLNLLGFALRPGFGYAVDDWRVARTWRHFHHGPAFPRHEQCRAEWWILWRRIAGGLAAGQQQALAEPLASGLRTLLRERGDQARKGKKGRGKSKSKRPTFPRPGHEAAEAWRLLGALEELDTELKTWLGETALGEIERDGPATLSGAPLWALARLGARQPVHGGLHTILPAETAETWLDRLLRLPPERDVHFAILQIARRTGDRFRDISPETREHVAARLVERGAPGRWAELVREEGRLESEEQRLVLGDALPKGLVIR